MSTLNNFDVNELILQLHGELKFAFEVANSSGKQAGMQLDKLKVKFGKQNLMEEDNDTLILNADRYPSDENWELEVDYKYGDPIPDLEVSPNWISGDTSQIILKRLADTEVEKIKGVSSFWKKKFVDTGIVTIKHLATASSDKILELCRLHHSSKPLEFQTKVLLMARNFKPLQFTQFGDLPILTLINKSTAQLKKLFLNKLSGPEIADLRAMVLVINLCLDKKLCEKLKLNLLLVP